MLRRALVVIVLTLLHATLAYAATTVAAMGAAVRAFTNAPPSIWERVAEPAARVLLLPLAWPLMHLAQQGYPESAAIGVFLLNSLVWGAGTYLFAYWLRAAR